MIRENRPFAGEEDAIIRQMYQNQGIKNWGMIAQALTTQHGFPRNARQCRDRYHQFLNQTPFLQWTEEEEQKLYRIHEEIGNKWASIASSFPGKTDNCVKNHFYSKLRKALRHLNKSIKKNFRKQFKELKMVSLYKIIEALGQKFHQNIPIDQQKYASTLKLKRQLLDYADACEKSNFQNPAKQKDLITRVEQFNKNHKRKSKLEKRNSFKNQDLFKSSAKQNHEFFSSDNGSSGSEYSFAFSHGDESGQKNQERNFKQQELIAIEEDLRESNNSKYSQFKSIKDPNADKKCQYMMVDEQRLMRNQISYADGIQDLLREKCVIQEQIESEQLMGKLQNSRNSFGIKSDVDRMDMFGDDLRLSAGMHQMKEQMEEEEADQSLFRSHK